MTISAWLSRVQDFLNLGKVMVDGGPGVVLAIALSIVAASIAKLPLLPVDTVGTRFATELVELETKIENARFSVATLSAGSAVQIRQLESLSADLEALKQDLKTIRAAEGELLKGGKLGGQGPRTRLHSLEGEIEQLEIRAEDYLRGQEVQKGYLEGEQQKLEELTSERTELLADRVTSLNSLFDYILNNLIGLVLIGYVLGTLMSPINRALFVDSLEWLLNKLNRQAKEQRKYGFALRNTATADAKAPADDEERKKEKEKENQEKDLQLIKDHPWSFFVGLKVISQEERDSLVTSHYRWVEASMNLVIPIFALGSAAAFALCRSERYESIKVGWWVPLMIAAIMCFGLCWTARERLVDYRYRVNKLILGRLQKIRKEEEEAAQAKKLADVSSKLIKKFEDLLEKAKPPESNTP